MNMRSLILTASLIALCGCNGYRPVSLPEQVKLVKSTQEADIQETRDVFNGQINEDNAIKLALSFNPNIRTPIIRERGWGDNEVQFRGVARPELDVETDSVTLGFSVDMFSLYNLLSPTERHVWREMRNAERRQALSNQKGAVIILTRDVRLSFLEIARLSKKLEIMNRQLSFVTTYQKSIKKNLDVNTSILFSLSIAEIKENIIQTNNELTSAKLTLIRLLGIEPNQEMTFDTSTTLNVTVMPEVKTIKEMTEYAKQKNWQLISLYSNYVIKEYELRQYYLRRWGEVSVGPSVTVNRDDETTVGFSFRVRIPWPSHSEDRITDKIDDRAIAGAQYTAALHNLHADITKQYIEMQEKWESIKNPQVSVEWMKSVLESNSEGADIHTYLDMSNRIFNQEVVQLNDIAKYKMSGIILDSLCK